MQFKVHPAQTAENLRAYTSLNNVGHNTRKALRKAFYHIGNDVHEDTKALILSKEKTGRLYLLRLNGRLKRHRASAPGEAPANLTGNLRRSIGFKVRSFDRVEIGAEAEYARFLELGTSKMEARPYLIAAIKSNYSNIRNHLERELKNALS